MKNYDNFNGLKIEKLCFEVWFFFIYPLNKREIYCKNYITKEKENKNNIIFKVNLIKNKFLIQKIIKKIEKHIYI